MAAHHFGTSPRNVNQAAAVISPPRHWNPFSTFPSSPPLRRHTSVCAEPRFLHSPITTSARAGGIEDAVAPPGHSGLGRGIGSLVPRVAPEAVGLYFVREDLVHFLREETKGPQSFNPRSTIDNTGGPVQEASSIPLFRSALLEWDVEPGPLEVTESWALLELNHVTPCRHRLPPRTPFQIERSFESLSRIRLPHRSSRKEIWIGRGSSWIHVYLIGCGAFIPTRRSYSPCCGPYARLFPSGPNPVPIPS